eukprot:GHVO01047669.1.p1 GENE.GHVO01047669.1~~GHVO01047669.1.p1  ORF type:complete len:181 (+),score=14.05 GHVO01047669.1:378-920(+)
MMRPGSGRIATNGSSTDNTCPSYYFSCERYLPLTTLMLTAPVTDTSYFKYLTKTLWYSSPRQEVAPVPTKLFMITPYNDLLKGVITEKVIKDPTQQTGGSTLMTMGCMGETKVTTGATFRNASTTYWDTSSTQFQERGQTYLSDPYPFIGQFGTGPADPPSPREEGSQWIYDTCQGTGQM